jgi:hypothetical protein
MPAFAHQVKRQHFLPHINGLQGWPKEFLFGCPTDTVSYQMKQTLAFVHQVRKQHRKYYWNGLAKLQALMAMSYLHLECMLHHSALRIFDG